MAVNVLQALAPYSIAAATVVAQRASTRLGRVETCLILRLLDIAGLAAMAAIPGAGTETLNPKPETCLILRLLDIVGLAAMADIPGAGTETLSAKLRKGFLALPCSASLGS